MNMLNWHHRERLKEMEIVCGQHDDDDVAICTTGLLIEGKKLAVRKTNRVT